MIREEVLESDVPRHEISPSLKHGEARTASISDESIWASVLDQLDKASQIESDRERAGFDEFRLDFDRALARQLGPFIDRLPPQKLNPENLKKIPKGARGAYYLILEDSVVYIGKTDAAIGLKARLAVHYKKLKRRKHINWEGMCFKAVEVISFAALDTETILLDLYKRRAIEAKLPKHQHRPEWNGSGLGSNDTGIKRDTQSVSLFDQLHPLNLDALIEFDVPLTQKKIPLANYLDWLREELQITLRRQTKAVPLNKALTKSVSVKTMTATPTLEGLLLAVHKFLPRGWVLTVLRGKIVLYLNDRTKYLSPLWQLKPGCPAPNPDYTLREVSKKGEDIATEQVV